MEKKIRMKEIAKLAGVSTMTVSNVVHGKNEKTGIETRLKVQKILNEMNYHVNVKASLLAGSMLKLIVVLDKTNRQERSAYYKIRTMEETIYSQKQYALIHFVKHVEEGVDYIKEWEADAVITLGFSSFEIEYIEKQCSCPIMIMEEGEEKVVRRKIHRFIEELNK